MAEQHRGMSNDAPTSFRLFLGGPIVHGEPLQLMARAEGDDGILGDMRADVPPGQDAFGVPFAVLRALLQVQGWVDVPPAGDAGAQARQSLVDQAYMLTFGHSGPQPMCINPTWRAEVMADAVAAGEPIPGDFDWYAHLPPDAVA